MSTRCPDCHERIVFGTEHLGGCRYLTLRPKELRRAHLRRKLS